MTDNKVIRLDIEAALKEKLPRLRVPKLVVNYLRKIAHEKEFNYFFESNPDLKGVDFMEGAFHFFDAKVEVFGKENLPTDPRFILVSNHPLGGLDGITIPYIFGRHYNDKILLLTNDLLMNLHPLKDIFIPINKSGAQSKHTAELANRMYESDNLIFTFPAGLCSRKIKGEIVDLEWKKNFINKAVSFQRDVVPIYFEGRNSNFFYNLSNLRKRLGIKINIEMLYLSDEMFNQKGKQLKIVIGKPIAWQTFDKTKTPTQWAQWVKGKTYDLKIQAK
jgi:putative hemolysin